MDLNSGNLCEFNEWETFFRLNFFASGLKIIFNPYKSRTNDNGKGIDEESTMDQMGLQLDRHTHTHTHAVSSHAS